MPGRPSPSTLRVKGVSLDLQLRSVSFRRRTVSLTRREMELFEFLARHPDRYFRVEELRDLAWHAPYGSPEEVRVYISRLRAKLRPLDLPVKLASRQWLGYCLEVEPRANPVRSLVDLARRLHLRWRL